jgi:exodeoxyribonuclease VII large subunit
MTQNAPLFTVSQLTQAIKLKLESMFPSIWLQGEISNFKHQTSGHLYFSLKDAHAQISAVMFKNDVSLLPLLPKDGSHVIVRGEMNVYPPTGKYQIVVRELKLMGVGELLLKLEELKIKLHKKGYFKSDRKKPLPRFPKKIGVITSPTGAVIQDILNVLNRRFSGFRLLLNPVKVQGEGAAQEIARAIKFFNDNNLVDVMIVGRGGGSIEDLWAFNEEIVADAIFTSHIPVISAVGHETDHCIADYVADVRAPTPSAAAEIVIAEKSQQMAHLTQLQRRMAQCLKHCIQQGRHRLNGILRQPVFATPYALLGQWMQRLDYNRDVLDDLAMQKIRHFQLRLDAFSRQLQALRPHAKIFHSKQKLMQLEKAINSAWLLKQQARCQTFTKELLGKRLDFAWMRVLQARREKLAVLSEALKSIDPKKLLSKGYAILFSEKDQSVITSVRMTTPEQSIRVLLGDGEIQAQIKEIREKQ